MDRGIIHNKIKLLHFRIPIHLIQRLLNKTKIMTWISSSKRRLIWRSYLPLKVFDDFYFLGRLRDSYFDINYSRLPRFPICSTLQQCNIAFRKLSESFWLATYNYSQQNLSIRGYTTVLNTLIYSKLWHIMRVTTFTQAQLLSLRGIGSSFINFCIFPKISFSTLNQPRHLGVLNILDSIIQ